jgi:hypothetical protein
LELVSLKMEMDLSASQETGRHCIGLRLSPMVLSLLTQEKTGITLDIQSR